MKKIKGTQESRQFVKTNLRPRTIIDVEVQKVCSDIISKVRSYGDSALKSIMMDLDKSSRQEMEVTREEVDNAFDEVDKSVLASIQKSIERSKDFHKKSLPNSWHNANKTLGENVIPVDRVLCYVPGGSAPLVSTAIMTVVPANIAGVSEIFVTTPPAGKKINNEIVVAAKLSGADKIYSIGGAQAIAAFTYGTESIPKVDVICGPGNKYVTEAKRAVFGDVGIDGLYGPTETLIVADKDSNVELCAADLIAQAEHDVEATPILITDSEEFADLVVDTMNNMKKGLSRETIIQKSIINNGRIFVLDFISDAVDLVNLISAEHVSIITDSLGDISEEIKNAGGLFIGEDSAEVFGDYIAGPSHVMPTGGSARFNSALNVRHFLKFQPFINLSKEEALNLVDDVSLLAEIEGLDGHKNSAIKRKENLIGE